MSCGTFLSFIDFHLELHCVILVTKLRTNESREEMT